MTVVCTKGATTAIGLNAGANAPRSGSTRAMVHSGGSNTLSYEIYKDSGRTTVWGNSGSDLLNAGIAPDKNPRSFSAHGRIPAGQDVPAGSYADTVIATIDF